MFSLFKKDSSAAFWDWFTENEGRLFEFEKEQEKIFNELISEMRKVHPALTFEFSSAGDGKREFVISADGNRDAFPAVEKLFDLAPPLAKFTPVKFRQRRAPLCGLNVNGREFDPADITFQLSHENGKVALMVFFPDYSEKEHQLFLAAGFIMLDQALGEYDMETKVGAVEFAGPESEYFEGSKPLTELAGAFDSRWAEISKEGSDTDESL